MCVFPIYVKDYYTRVPLVVYISLVQMEELLSTIESKLKFTDLHFFFSLCFNGIKKWAVFEGLVISDGKISCYFVMAQSTWKLNLFNMIG